VYGDDTAFSWRCSLAHNDILILQTGSRGNKLAHEMVVPFRKMDVSTLLSSGVRGIPSKKREAPGEEILILPGASRFLA